MKRMYNRKIKTNARKSVHRRNYRNFTKKYNKTTCRTLKNRFTSKITNIHKKSLKMMFRKTNVNFDNVYNYPLKIINKKKFVTVKKLRTKHTVININLKKTANHKIKKMNTCNYFAGYHRNAKYNHSYNRKILKLHNEMRTKLNMNEILPTFKLTEPLFLPEIYSDVINARRIKLLINNIILPDEILNEFMHNKKIPIIERDEFKINMNDTAKYFSNEHKKYKYDTMYVVSTSLLFSLYCVGSLIIYIPALALCSCVVILGAVLIYGFWVMVLDMVM